MEELKQKMIGLKAQMETLDNDRQELQYVLDAAEKDYREASLPEITEDFSELIENSIRAAVNDIGFSDEENYDISHEINYKELNTELNLKYDIREELISLILTNVTELFKVIENGN